MRGRQAVVALATLLVLGLVWWAQGGLTTEPEADGRKTASTNAEDGFPAVRVAELPAEARDVLARIDAGGPFKYPGNDGVTFENREGLLPEQPRGYYEEYTVERGPDERGPWRIVTGDELDEVYWTEDHYRSFARIEDHGIESLE